MEGWEEDPQQHSDCSQVSAHLRNSASTSCLESGNLSRVCGSLSLIQDHMSFSTSGIFRLIKILQELNGFPICFTSGGNVVN